MCFAVHFLSLSVFPPVFHLFISPRLCEPVGLFSSWVSWRFLCLFLGPRALLTSWFVLCCRITVSWSWFSLLPFLWHLSWRIARVLPLKFSTLKTLWRCILSVMNYSLSDVLTKTAETKSMQTTCWTQNHWQVHFTTSRSIRAKEPDITSQHHSCTDRRYSSF